jgi:glycosyltransferase involved in cell wall biosynthesis
MHSGNHSLAHPLGTLLDAARALRDDARIRFVFIGGGVGKREVEAAVRESLPNVLALPYQPLEKLAETLAAADVQVVAMGEAMVGCVHPRKVYGALAAARPVLYLGPADSHVGEIISAGVGGRVAHGDTRGAAVLLRELAVRSPAEMAEIGSANRRLTEERFEAGRLRAEFCSFIEEMVARAPGDCVESARGPGGWPAT